MFSTLYHCWMQQFGSKIFIASFRSKVININYYEALGIPKTSTQNDIKSAYYKLSMQYHPDKNQGCEDSARKFREITQAYEVLGNYQLRRLYDKGAVHTAEYAHPTASASASETIVREDDDPATKFYKSRLRKTHVADTFDRSTFDFDEWSRAHYGYSFQRRREAKHRYDEQEGKRASDAASKAHEVLLFGLIFACVAFYASFYTQGSYDTPKEIIKFDEETTTNGPAK